MRTKSPLKGKPLRTPGQSLERRLIDIAFDDVVFGFIMIAVTMGLAFNEWVKWFSDLPPSPGGYTIVAGVTFLWGVWRIRKGLRQARSVKLGISGEKAVGHFLERLRVDGAVVFHDIPGDNFNLDHVVIHTSGIYVIETKTMSKPETGKPELEFTGSEVLRNGHPIKGDPITQVTAASYWLTEVLNQSTGRKHKARGVVVFPGWFIKSASASSYKHVWVLNPKAVPAFIKNQPQELSAEDVHLYAYHLSRFVTA